MYLIEIIERKMQNIVLNFEWLNFTSLIFVNLEIKYLNYIKLEINTCHLLN